MLTIKTKLGLSKIHGIGLFADQFVPRGTTVWRKHPLDPQLTQKEMGELSQVEKQFVLHYGYKTREGNYVLCLDNARFCNHSDIPNFDASDEENNFALRDIAIGEELICDYNTFEHGEEFIQEEESMTQDKEVTTTDVDELQKKLTDTEHTIQQLKSQRLGLLDRIWRQKKQLEEADGSLRLSDDECSALIEACNVASQHNPRPPWQSAGREAWDKLLWMESHRNKQEGKCKGVAKKIVIKVIGEEGSGKTTIAALIVQALIKGNPPFLVNPSNTPENEEWVKILNRPGELEQRILSLAGGISVEIETVLQPKRDVQEKQ